MLRVYTREASKDWRWKQQLAKVSELESQHHKRHFGRGKKPVKQSADFRPPGWLYLTLPSDRSGTYEMDMVAHKYGFKNTLNVDVKSPSMTSSVNHDLVWRSKSLLVSCDLSNPLAWNAQRNWSFNVQSHAFELFLLRDHVFLLTDLVDDWTSGPPATFLTFVPFQYTLKFSFSNFIMYLNINELNIIDRPTARDDNAFLLLKAKSLEAVVGMPMLAFQASRNQISFDGHASDLSFDLSAPSWNTQHTFLQGADIASLSKIRVDGSYNYFSSTSSTLTDTLVLTIRGHKPVLHAHGVLIKYFLIFEANYLGKDKHFQTLEEYQASLSDPGGAGLSRQDANQLKVVNDLDVILNVEAAEGLVRLPALVYSARENISIDIPRLDLDMRFTNYYMDLMVTVAPLSLGLGQLQTSSAQESTEKMEPEVLLDGLSISGHRLFGLPPTEPTYVCNWEFGVGSVNGECSLDFLSTTVAALKAFAFGFADTENSLQQQNVPVLHDITFLRASVKPITLWVLLDDSAFHLGLDSLEVEFNDWAGTRFSERISILVPKLALACVDARLLPPRPSRTPFFVESSAYLQTALHVQVLESKAHFPKDRRLQQEHVALHDSRTHRTPWLLHDPDQLPDPPIAEDKSPWRPPAMPVPPMPDPFVDIDGAVDNMRLPLSGSEEDSLITGHRPSSFLYANGHGNTQIESPPLSSGRSPSAPQVRRDNFSRTSSYVSSRAFSPGFLATAKQKDEAVLTPSTLSNRTFRLRACQVRASYLPLLDASPPADHQDFEDGLEDQPDAADDDFARTTFLISLGKGVSAFLTPEAVRFIDQALSQTQPQTVDGSLDSLQLASLDPIISASKAKAKGKAIQLRVDLPKVAVRFHDTEPARDGPRNKHASADMILQSCNFVTRLGSLVTEDSLSKIRETMVAHGALQSIKLVLHESSYIGLHDLAQVYLGFEELTIWTTKDRQLIGQAQLHGLALDATYQDGEHLASLLGQTSALATSMAGQFASTNNARKQSLQSLVYLLATLHQDVPDPAALTQASYVLRAATVHPRGTDEWKMMCRLRWISRWMTDADREKLAIETVVPTKPSLKQKCDEVVMSFRRWRSWDLANARRNHLMKHVYGAIASDGSRSRLAPSMPLNMRVHAGEIAITIDRGPQESTIRFEQLAIAVRSKCSRRPQAKAVEQLTQESTVQIACAGMDVRLDWGLCPLASTVASQLAKVRESPSKAASARPSDPTSQLQHDIHAVVALEAAVFCVQTINLVATSSLQNFAASLVLGAGSLRDALAIATFSTQLLQSKVATTAKTLLTSELQQSIVHASLARRQSTSGEARTVKAGAFCSDLSLDIQEDMLGLLGAIDRVLSEEVSYLKESLPARESASASKTTIKRASDPQESSIVLSLSSYRLSATFLSSLRYVVSGKAARSSTKVTSTETLNLTMDLDLRGQKHAFQNWSNGSIQEVSALDLPPLNGQAVVALADKRHQIDAFISIEEIGLDASEVHALVSTLSRREVSHFWSTVVRDAKVVQSNYESIADKEGPKKSEPRHTSVPVLLFYNVRMAMAGVNLIATAGGSSQLVLEVGRIHSEVINQEPGRVLPLPFAEIVVDVTSLGVTLHRADGNGTRSSGDFALAASLHGTSKTNDQNQLVRSFETRVPFFEINMYPETAPMIVDVLGYLQKRFKNFSLTEEIHTLRARRRRTKSQAIRLVNATVTDEEDTPSVLFTSMYSIEVVGLQISWRVGDMTAVSPGHEVEDLVFSIAKIDLASSKGNDARLVLQDMQLQMVPTSQSAKIRSRNSALMPELVFKVAYLSRSQERRLIFQASGKSVDLRLTSQFVPPAYDLQRSIALATRDLREVIAGWNKSFVQEEQQSRKILGNKRLSLLLVAVDFDGAVVHLQSTRPSKSQPIMLAAQSRRRSTNRVEPVPRSPEDTANTTTLRTPGIAVQVEYQHPAGTDPILNGEVKVEASSNTLQPSLVALFKELSSSVREIVQEQEHDKPQFLESQSSPVKFTDDAFLQVTDPNAILGNCSLNLGLRIRKQQFGLTCQPIAKVSATAEFESIYITVNTVQGTESNRFFAVSALFTKLQASVKHAYSRESTGHFQADTITLSLMNSRHVSNLKGVSAILRFSPMSLFVNARQLNDFLLFREIWLPTDTSDPPPVPAAMTESHASLSVQRYQRVAAAGGFPWNATVSFETLDVQVDLGQSLGKATFTIKNLWLTSKKQSDWEQDLCVGFEKIALGSVGRLSGSLELQSLRLRTSIQWPDTREIATPLVQASLGFENIQAKAAFEYQAFFVADFSSLDLLMFNIRSSNQRHSDRLVAIVNSDKAQAFITTQSASMAYAVYQALQKMVQEKRTAYENSVKEIESYYRRRSSRPSQGDSLTASSTLSPPSVFSPIHSGTQLQTNVVVHLRALNVGAYPKTFFDGTIFKLEALNASAAFSVRRDEEAGLASRLSLQLGQVRIALSSVPRTLSRTSFEELAVSTVVQQSTGSRGGTILKVPRLVAAMRTHQADAKATHIEYGFRSSFEGRVEVGWNINRINFIRGMWETHSKALSQRLGRNVTQTRVLITGLPGELEKPDPQQRGNSTSDHKTDGGEKITAVVNVPQSRYTYAALEPPVIETPQLRDMGEATPPLEWIGLHRDRLPNVTHQIVIVPLLEIAREVEDAYARILGAS